MSKMIELNKTRVLSLPANSMQGKGDSFIWILNANNINKLSVLYFLLEPRHWNNRNNYYHNLFVQASAREVTKSACYLDFI